MILEFFIPSDSLEIIRGSQVDYTIEGLNQGVKFITLMQALYVAAESFTVKDEKFNSDTSTAQKKIKNIAS